jgi:hypothetical protein
LFKKSRRKEGTLMMKYLTLAGHMHNTKKESDCSKGGMKEQANDAASAQDKLCM